MSSDVFGYSILLTAARSHEYIEYRMEMFIIRKIIFLGVQITHERIILCYDNILWYYCTAVAALAFRAPK